MKLLVSPTARVLKYVSMFKCISMSVISFNEGRIYVIQVEIQYAETAVSHNYLSFCLIFQW